MEDFNGVVAIVFKKGQPRRFALIHNKKTGNISFPAGGREEGEASSIQTLEREVLEETGLRPDQYKVITTGFVHEFVYGPSKKERAGQRARQPVYFLETSRSRLKPNDPDSKIDGWYPAEEVVKKLTFQDAKTLFKKALDFL
jgi:8-oxo-dGTP pyrophosphatase MutT (NUDIX family)